MKKLAALSIGMILSATASFAGCAGVEDACEIPEGTYHAEGPTGTPKGALMFLHGWGSSGSGSMKMRGMVNGFLDAGYAVIAPDGTPREGRSGRGWIFHPYWDEERSEHEFLAAVRDDAAERFGFDPKMVMLSGFSIGGSMAAYVACLNPTHFSAYAPIGGNLWRPHPEACEGPVRMLHTHGWSDGVVPIEGRLLRGEGLTNPDSLIQGDSFHAMELFRVANDCANHKPDRFDIGETYWRRAWERCADGSALEFALHRGGHSVPKGWAAMALEWFEGQMLSN